MELYNLMTVIYAVATVMAIGAYFLTRKYQEPAIRYLAIMLIFSFLVDAFGLLDFHWLHSGRWFSIPQNLYAVIEIVAVFMLYQVKLLPDKKLPFIILASALVIMQAVELLVFRDIFAFPGTTRTVFAIIVTILALLYFFKLMRDLPTIHIYNIPMFWINIGMLVYFTGNFFLFMIEDYLVRVLKNNMIYYWSFHNFMGIISYLLMTIGLWQVRSQKTTHT